MAILSQTIAIPIWAAVVSIVATVAIAVLLRGLEIKRQLAAVIGIAALLAAVSGAIVSSDRTTLATSVPQDRALAGPDAERRASGAGSAAPPAPSARATQSAPAAPQISVTAAPLPTAPTAISTATMALVGSGLAPNLGLSSAATSPPLVRTRPMPAEVAAPTAMAAAPAAAERPPAASPARGSRGVVPPVASVLPNLEFPSSNSVPPVSIMNAEPPLPAAESAPSTSSTAPKPSPRSQ